MKRNVAAASIGALIAIVLTGASRLEAQQGKAMAALAQDPAKATTESIVSGVKVIRDELMRVLQNHGVKVIESAKNSPFEPSIHQAVMQVDSPDVEPGHIVATLQPGFMLGERVIRPATVTVRPASAADGIGEDPLKGGG